MNEHHALLIIDIYSNIFIITMYVFQSFRLVPPPVIKPTVWFNYSTKLPYWSIKSNINVLYWLIVVAGFILRFWRIDWPNCVVYVSLCVILCHTYVILYHICHTTCISCDRHTVSYYIMSYCIIICHTVFYQYYIICTCHIMS